MGLDISELARACVHCGLCLPQCPTYRVLREEADSPRGRILLMEALELGRAREQEVRRHLDRCIGCRGCESVCPSGVPYGELLESTRARIAGPKWWVKLFLRHAVPRPRVLRFLIAIARRVRWMPPRGPRLAWPAPPERPRARAGLHLGCVTPVLFPNLAAEAAHVLTRLGYAVAAPPDQVCCGALHRHAGLPDDAFAARNRTAFAGCDVVVSAAAGCSASEGLTDVCELLLADESFPGARLAPVTVAYDAPCHLLHAQRIDAAALLDRIEGITRVPLEDSDVCCGAGGLYMETERELATRVRAEKLDAIRRSGAQVVATPNPGCMLWLARGAREAGLGVKIVHPVSLLARAWGVC